MRRLRRAFSLSLRLDLLRPRARLLLPLRLFRRHRALDLVLTPDEIFSSHQSDRGRLERGVDALDGARGETDEAAGGRWDIARGSRAGGFSALARDGAVAVERVTRRGVVGRRGGWVGHGAGAPRRVPLDRAGRAGSFVVVYRLVVYYTSSMSPERAVVVARSSIPVSLV